MFITGKRNNRRAFTLVEIVVVLLIMAVVLTMTTVSLSGAIGGVAARESANRVAGALRFARYYAAIHNCPCQVTFSRQNNSYELTCRPNPEKDDLEPLPGGRVALLDSHVRFSTIDIQSQHSETENRDVITFDPTGECDGARIEITDDKVVYTIILSPYSSLVRLHKGPLLDIPSDREDLDG